jgi:hypothetical protein
MDLIFKRIADAAAAALAGLPEVGGRVYTELDVALQPDQLPAINVMPGDDTSNQLDSETTEIRMELQLHILTNTVGALASVSAVEQAAHLRLMADEALGGLLAVSLRRLQGSRRILRNTEGSPAHRLVIYECRCYVASGDLASLL